MVFIYEFLAFVTKKTHLGKKTRLSNIVSQDVKKIAAVATFEKYDEASLG